MRNHLLGVLAFAFMAISGASAHAATGEPYLPENTTRAQIIAMMHGSLQRDPQGHAKLMPAQCEQQNDSHACATPYDYLVAYQEYDPDAHLTSVSQLEGYLSSLVDEMAPDGDDEYSMSCLVPTGASHQFKPLNNCNHRPFNKGEMVSINPRTKRIVLAWHCKNPVGGMWSIKITQPPCAFVNATTHRGDVIRYGTMIADGENMDDVRKCLGVKLPGETAFHPFTDDCPDFHCSFTRYESQTGLRSAVQGSARSPGGVVIIRVPSYFTRRGSKDAVVLCLKQKNGMQSCGKEIIAASYRPKKTSDDAEAVSEMNAYVTYEGEPAEGPSVNWHWDSPEHPCPRG